MSRFRSFWRNLLQRNRVERDLDDEVKATFDLLVDEKVQSGMPEDVARRAARLELGGLETLKDQVRDARAGASVDTFIQDLRYAFRLLVRAPGFTVVAIVTLALGIGANAAVFSVLKSVLLDALPYTEADRLVRVHGRLLDGTQDRGPLSAGTINTIATRQRSFESLAAFQSLPVDVVYGAEDGAARSVKLALVESQFLETLGIPAVRGRTFHRDDAASGLLVLSGPQAASETVRSVIVTDAAWQRLFGGNTDIVGRELLLNGLPRTVIGVLPRGFIGPMGEADFYSAVDLEPVAVHPILGRRSQWLGLVGRLKPGVTHQAAREEVAVIWADLVREYPQDNSAFAMNVMPLRDSMVGDTRTPLFVLMASAALVLLIACANLASALLSRTLTRRKEFAVRMALGAGRMRLVRQLLTESTVLALAGGTAGLLLATLILGLIRGLARQALPAFADLSLDQGVVVVTAMIALCTGLMFGVAPALSVGSWNPQGPLRDESRGASESRRSRRLRGALVAGQMALCVSLLAGAGLLGRSLWAMISAPLGFDSNGVLTAILRLPPREYPTPEARGQFLEQLEERLRIIPGVNAAAIATSAPTAIASRNSFVIEGAPPLRDGEAEPFVLSVLVSDEYFRTLRIPLRQGRTFDAQDRFGGPPRVVISESMARRYWPTGQAIGTRIRMGADTSSPFIEVVGIVGDVRNNPARPDFEPMAYRSTRQVPAGIARILLRTEGDPMTLVRSVESEVATLAPGVPLDRPMTLRAVVGEGLATRRLPVILITAFGALALLLASVGVYAMFANMAAARELEFGVRMALGSRPIAIAVLVLRQGAGWMAAGLAGGVFGIIIVVRLVRDLLYGVAPFDPMTLGLAVAILVGCATLALLIPLRRATRVEPSAALRVQ